MVSFFGFGCAGNARMNYAGVCKSCLKQEIDCSCSMTEADKDKLPSAKKNLLNFKDVSHSKGNLSPVIYSPN
jgi:hypothetical protein